MPKELETAQQLTALAIEFLVKYGFQIHYRANQNIHSALAEAKITIPFPQRDLHIVSESGS